MFFLCIFHALVCALFWQNQAVCKGSEIMEINHRINIVKATSQCHPPLQRWRDQTCVAFEKSFSCRILFCDITPVCVSIFVSEKVFQSYKINQSKSIDKRVFPFPTAPSSMLSLTCWSAPWWCSPSSCPAPSLVWVSTCGVMPSLKEEQCPAGESHTETVIYREFLRQCGIHKTLFSFF